MKNFLLFTVLIVSIISCSKDNGPDLNEGNTELLSSWKLIEILADPGDGSGTFQAVTSDKTISFFADGTITSNGIICDMSTESNMSSTGTYNETDMTIELDDCSFTAPFAFTYEIIDQELIIHYPCFEACQCKFEEV